ncbi:hypothetical protein BLOT_009274 [Blomia tropicalis]|nr:hypothetical protein BLOT_009274 [Blomia tropicalis]
MFAYTILCLLLYGLPLGSMNDSAPNKKWQLVDNFEFNYDSSTSFRNDPDWSIDDEPENLCVGENIFQYSCHRMKNVAIQNGHLVIRADVNQWRGSSRFLFNSGKVASLKSWQYGKFVMRAMLPAGKLLRAVFLLKPRHMKYAGSWVDNGQMNGLVYAQQADSIITGIHYNMSHGQSYLGRLMKTKYNLTDSYHLYTVEWNNHTIRWYFDDMLVFENEVGKPFDQPFYFILQLGVGGPEFDTRHLTVTTNDSSQWINPRFVIDYVKVYQDASTLTQHSSSTNCKCKLSTILLFLLLAIFLFL